MNQADEHLFGIAVQPLLERMVGDLDARRGCPGWQFEIIVVRVQHGGLLIWGQCFGRVALALESATSMPWAPRRSCGAAQGHDSSDHRPVAPLRASPSRPRLPRLPPK